MIFDEKTNEAAMKLYDEDRVHRTAFKVLVARLAFPDEYVAETARRVGVSRQQVYRVVHRARALGATVPDRGAGRTLRSAPGSQP